MYDPTATWHHFRQRARESRGWAEESASPVIREIYARLAATFDSLADWAEEFAEAARRTEDSAPEFASTLDDLPAVGAAPTPDGVSPPAIVEHREVEHRVPGPVDAKAGPKPGGHKPMRRRLESRSPLPGLELGGGPPIVKERL
jgi:hypothetical protein